MNYKHELEKVKMKLDIVQVELDEMKEIVSLMMPDEAEMQPKVAAKAVEGSKQRKTQESKPIKL